MGTSDNIFANELGIRGVSPLRASAPVRAFLHKDLVAPSRLVAALLVGDTHLADGKLPTVPPSQIEAAVLRMWDLGVKSVKLFVHCQQKDDCASQVGSPDGLSPTAIRLIKQSVPMMCVITDTCLCSYTHNGNCAVVTQGGEIDLSATFDRLSALALAQARAGADIIGPAPMCEGAVAHLRRSLDASGYFSTPLLPHVSWRSALYRQYRSTMETGSGRQRQAFQIDPSCPDQFFSMVDTLFREGASAIQMQPGIFSLDLVRDVKQRCAAPVGLYSVSGEYVMMKCASTNEYEFFELAYEHATSAFRSGADFLVTYAWQEIITGKRQYLGN